MSEYNELKFQLVGLPLKKAINLMTEQNYNYQIEKLSSPKKKPNNTNNQLDQDLLRVVNVGINNEAVLLTTVLEDN
ncbi:hypothetical protein [Natranaerobius trueperi]|uniref:Uncharacterized protein n=1 Tax=Natranaerobius trueperi TaxID=759412 RepID=A0A226BZ09_9FIRM|nr:hypothetical protein [Natranaerobius trueperi]OWZ84263.1 hypothetical protein CDO51_04185 [Natranaerobius trueperi]